MTRRVRKFLFDNVRGKLLTDTSAVIKGTENEGIKQDDFATSAIQISSEPFANSDTVLVSAAAIENRIGYHTDLFNNAASQQNTYIATANQTIFDARYSVGHVEVFVNGSKLVASHFTATTGTNIILNVPSSAGDTIDIVGHTILLSTYANNFDGGSAATIYTPLQSVDAGSAMNAYTAAEAVDGGTA